MTIKIAILGLRQTGASIGLALGQIKDQATRVGNDKDPGTARQAEKAGAVDKVSFTIPAAVYDADLVVLALPVDEVRFTLEAIAPDLKPGVVVVDTCPVKEPVMQWANEFFPGSDRYFVSITLSQNPAYLMESGAGIEDAHADLFKNGLMHISSLPGTDESALSLVTNLAQILGASPLFADIYEVDGLLASTRLLPEIISAALVNSTTSQPGWREARKVAGHAYALSTELALYPEEDKELGLAAQLNSENMVRVIDQFISEMQELRDIIANQDAAELQKRLKQAQANRADWWKQRASADWETQSKQNVRLPTSADVFGRMFGIFPKKKDQ